MIPKKSLLSRQASARRRRVCFSSSVGQSCSVTELSASVSSKTSALEKVMTGGNPPTFIFFFQNLIPFCLMNYFVMHVWAVSDPCFSHPTPVSFLIFLQIFLTSLSRNLAIFFWILNQSYIALLCLCSALNAWDAGNWTPEGERTLQQRYESERNADL